nr:protein detoxification 27 [Quercus suber]
MGAREEEEQQKPLLTSTSEQSQEEELNASSLLRQTWLESKKLWAIAGPSIFSRLAMFSMTVITQSFSGHLSDLDLAAISIASTVIIAITFGFLLGMASALETLCGQAYGARQYHMLGIYLQRSWTVLFSCSILLLPLFLFATPILKLMGQTDAVAEQSGVVAVWLIPMHLSFPFQFTLQRFLQSQVKTWVLAYISGGALALHVFVSWFFVYKLRVGIVGAALTLDFSWWVTVLGLFVNVVCGGCADSWTGFSGQAFVGLWDFFKLSVASGVMVAVRVANELGAGNAKGAKFATTISVLSSLMVGLLFWSIIIAFPENLAMIFTSSTSVIEMVNDLAVLLAFTILFNCIQPVLSGVAIGSGWQAKVAFINIGSYYLVGVPLGVLLGWSLHFGITGIWTGMISGTVIQTLILAVITLRCEWEKEAQKAQILITKEAAPRH